MAKFGCARLEREMSDEMLALRQLEFLSWRFEKEPYEVVVNGQLNAYCISSYYIHTGLWNNRRHHGRLCTMCTAMARSYTEARPAGRR